jgi:hypothetical protein
MHRKASLVAALFALLAAGAAFGQSPTDPVEEGAVEQSCKSLTGGTAGLPDHVPADSGGEPPASWPEAPEGLLPAAIHLRTPTQSFNRLYEFALAEGRIYARVRESLCFDGRVASISVDDDELIALDTARRVYTMDNALKDASTFNWTNRWGTPFWTGPGYTLPRTKAWSWSVISPLAGSTRPATGRRSGPARSRTSGACGAAASGSRSGTRGCRSTRATRCAAPTAAASRR